MFILKTLEYKRLIRMRDLGLIFSDQLSEQAIELTLALAARLSVLFNLAMDQVAAATRGVDLAHAERDAREALDVEDYAIAVAEYKEGVRLCTEIAKSIVQTMSDANTIAANLNVAVHQSLRNDPATLAQWDRACHLAVTEPTALMVVAA